MQATWAYNSIIYVSTIPVHPTLLAVQVSMSLVQAHPIPHTTVGTTKGLYGSLILITMPEPDRQLAASMPDAFPW